MKQIKVIVLSLIFPLVLANADKGGVDVRGGGGGIEIDGRMHSLDLVEAGVHEHPFYLLEEQDLAIRVELEAASLPSALPLAKIAQKLADIETVDAVFASALLEGIKTLSWNFVDLKISDTADFGNTVLDKKPVQLAVRQGSMVRIHKPSWLAMDADNRAALVFHEVIAAFAPETSPPSRVRRLVGELFTSSFYTQSANVVDSILKDFPSFYEFARTVDARDGVRGRLYTRAAIDGKLTGKIALNPQVTYNFVDQRSPWQRLSNIENTFPARVSVGPALEGTVYISPCEARKEHGYAIVKATLEASFVAVDLARPTAKKIVPKLVWRIKERHLGSIIIEAGRSAKLANCSSENIEAFQLIQRWAESLEFN